ncbi:MAG TPA: tubulin-like doman-containing protein [Pirellulales bacterium]|jgi:serine/threonine protein kinase|nr:tubulin-like doman-containing protein [Pirellulales bacterium]
MSTDTTTTPMPAPPGCLPEIIPGYQCIERLGAGGYGEVWKVLAPGGLAKALKLVYGQLDEERAVRELKALSEMKEVRYPFILSIERIEVVSGRLAIVAELADGSLKNRFDECRGEGLAGVPRAELLNYLRDAADALDYLCLHHQLQHLDIKPENLLLVGGRVKVADFGMVKSVQNSSASLLSSLTPVYAPPEVFDGRPNAASDQYSLAIVYYEMLTGSLPFSGRTTAQLAAQHLYGRPMLARLPAGDQPAIQRAMSKDPAQRFANCRTMVDALLFGGAGASSPSSSPAMAPSVPLAAEAATAPRATVALAPASIFSAGSQTSGPTGAASAEPAVAQPARSGAGRAAHSQPIELTPPRLQDSHAWARPTLFLGLGGLGGKTLGQLLQRLDDRFQRRPEISALQMLYLDTNVKAIYETVQSDPAAGLTANQVLAVPLQPSQEYRDDSNRLLKWLNRRWLYNVPRSLQTEGIRPLGRLAYVDHAEQVWSRVRAAITAACEPSSLTTSSALTGLSFAPTAPRVFIVASLAGGSGSGMAIDIAFGVRRLLAEMNFSDEHVCLVLAHATDRCANSREVALANGVACLTELFHFTRFPYADSHVDARSEHHLRGIPNTYLVRLGDDLGRQQLDSASANVAEFLYRGSLTSAAAFLDACRQPGAASENAFEPTVRSFGLKLLGGKDGGVAPEIVNAVCRTFIDDWRGVSDAVEQFVPVEMTKTLLIRERQSSDVTFEDEISSQAARQAEQVGLTANGITGLLDGLMLRLVGPNVAAWALKAFSPADISATNATAASLLEAIFTHLASSVEPYLAQLTDTISSALNEALLELMASHRCRVAGARMAADYLHEHCRNIKYQFSSELSGAERELHVLADPLSGVTPEDMLTIVERAAAYAPTPGTEQAEPVCLDILKRMLHGVVLHQASRLVGSVQRNIGQIKDELLELRRELTHLAEQFSGEPGKAARAPQACWWQTANPELVQELTRRLAEILSGIEQGVEAELIGPESKLRRTLKFDVALRNKLPVVLRSAARTAVRRLQKELSQLGDRALNRLDSGPRRQALRDAVAAAQPSWLDCGGAVRRLVVLPGADQSAEANLQLEQLSGGPCTVLGDTDEPPMIFFEAEQIPLRAVVATLAEGRTEIAQLAGRLHTRTDVPWSQLF